MQDLNVRARSQVEEPLKPRDQTCCFLHLWLFFSCLYLLQRWKCPAREKNEKVEEEQENNVPLMMAWNAVEVMGSQKVFSSSNQMKNLSPILQFLHHFNIHRNFHRCFSTLSYDERSDQLNQQYSHSKLKLNVGGMRRKKKTHWDIFCNKITVTTDAYRNWSHVQMTLLDLLSTC